jgi:hypothetical protein
MECQVQTTLLEAQKAQSEIGFELVDRELEQ